jgi:hypothetical protein
MRQKKINSTKKNKTILKFFNNGLRKMTHKKKFLVHINTKKNTQKDFFKKKVLLIKQCTKIMFNHEEF